MSGQHAVTVTKWDGTSRADGVMERMGDPAQTSHQPPGEPGPPESGFRLLGPARLSHGGVVPGGTGGSIPTGPFWLVKRRVRLLPSMLATLMLSPSVQ